MAESCCAGPKTLIFACSGGSNVGQISNEAAKRLDQDGMGNFFCLAGFAGDVSGIITSSREAENTVVIDGCNIACAKKAFERCNVPISTYVVVTDLGIEKGHHFNLSDDEIHCVCEAAKKQCAQ